MADRDWTPFSQALPPEGEAVETINSQGQVTDLVLKDGLLWFTDFTMYIYYTPVFWRRKAT